MKCKHKNTRKLFWSNTNPNRWERTDVSICLECQAILGMQPIKLSMTKETLKDRTKEVLGPEIENNDALDKESEVKV